MFLWDRGRPTPVPSCPWKITEKRRNLEASRWACCGGTHQTIVNDPYMNRGDGWRQSPPRYCERTCRRPHYSAWATAGPGIANNMPLSAHTVRFYAIRPDTALEEEKEVFHSVGYRGESNGHTRRAIGRPATVLPNNPTLRSIICPSPPSILYTVYKQQIRTEINGVIGPRSYK
jgi:hypothetical protein